MIHRSFLKWAGGKANALDSLWQAVPQQGEQLIEPFMGSATVSLNTEYADYKLYDLNADLVRLCRWAAKRPGSLIKAAKPFFCAHNNNAESYTRLRAAYNHSCDEAQRALLFLYLNRHGYNGLVRYSKKSGYNVPFGRYPSPYFPEEEILRFHDKFKSATIMHRSLCDLRLRDLSHSTVIYCDPPYLPLTSTARFAEYTQQGFCVAMQAHLDRRAAEWRKKGAKVFVSNHDAPILDDVYRRYQTKVHFDVTRTISQKITNRRPAKEVLLSY